MTSSSSTSSTVTQSTSTVASSSSSTAPAKDAGHDAGPPFHFDLDAACTPMPGAGATCDIGHVGCGDASCSVFATEAGPAQECCSGGGPGGLAICVPQGGTCKVTVDGGGLAIESCNTSFDCAPNKMCCLYVLSIAPPIGETACQTVTDAGGYTCACDKTDAGQYTCAGNPVGPLAPLVTAQVCKSDNECPSGACHIYCCAGTTIYACADPLPSLCSVVTTGSGC